MQIAPTARSVLLILILCLGATACQPTARTCPEVSEAERFLRGDELKQAMEATPVPFSQPITVNVGGREFPVDKVVTGALCNDTWRGTVYVGCDVRVPEWDEEPTFLEDCQLEVEPGTVVYVAAHNNSAYYQGCSCHTGVIELP